MLSNLPLASAPITRTVLPDRTLGAAADDGVHASQTSCEGLTGLAQQMCYAVLYGV